MNKVLLTTAAVASKDIQISKEAVAKFASEFTPYVKSDIEDSFIPAGLNEQDRVDWHFAVNLINFCFWNVQTDSENAIAWNGTVYGGYFSLLAAFANACKNGLELFRPSVYANVTMKQLIEIFPKNYPMLNERLEIMNHTGKVLLERFNGSFLNCVVNHSAKDTIDLILAHFDSFRDIFSYKNQNVYFLKRAQIVIAALYNHFDGQGYGRFTDIHELTMFADYRVPQALQYYGILKYSPGLIETLRNCPYLQSGDSLEMEIRAFSIQAVEEIRKALNFKVHSFEIDFKLWDESQRLRKEMFPFPIHKTETIFY